MPDGARLGVFRAVQLALLAARDVAAVGMDISVILRRNRSVRGPHGARLLAGHLTVAAFGVDAGDLGMLAAVARARMSLVFNMSHF